MSRTDRDSYSARRPRTQSSGRLSNQDSRDRLRKSRSTTHSHDTYRSAREKDPRKASRITHAPNYEEGTRAAPLSGSRDRFRDSDRDRERRKARERERDQPARRLRTSDNYDSHPKSSEPELRLRPPRRQRTQLGTPQEERSKRAERQRAAGTPGSSSRNKGGSKKSPEKKASGAITNKSLDPLRRTGGEGNNSSGKKQQRLSKEERDAQRKQSQRRKQQAQRGLKIIGIAAAASIVAVLAGWGIVTFLNSETFHVDTITVQGAHFLSDDTVIEIAAIDPTESTVTMDTDQVEQRLLQSPWISQASVSTQWTSGVTITLTERTPAVRVELRSPEQEAPAGDDDGVAVPEQWIATSDGIWLGYLVSGPQRIVDPTATVPSIDLGELTLIPITGVIGLVPEWGQRIDNEVLLNALALLRGLDPQIISQVTRIFAPDVGTTSLFTADEVELDVGRADNLLEKSTIILSILEEHGENVMLINVRSIDNPTWRGLSP